MDERNATYAQTTYSLAASVESLARQLWPDRGVYVTTTLLSLVADHGLYYYRVLACVASRYWHLSLVERTGVSTAGDDAAREAALTAVRDELLRRIETASPAA